MIDMERHVKGYKSQSAALTIIQAWAVLQDAISCSEPLFCGRRWSGLPPENSFSELEYLAKTY